MSKCLVLKLKESVNNPDLPYFNKFIIKGTELLTKSGSVGTLSVGIGLWFTDSSSGSLYNRTANQLVPVQIGETLEFSGLSNVYGANPVNIRLMLFDNANNKTINDVVTNNAGAKLLDTTLYNYNNYTKVKFTIPNTQDIQNASKPTLVIVFNINAASWTGEMGTGDITVDLTYPE